MMPSRFHHTRRSRPEPGQRGGHIDGDGGLLRAIAVLVSVVLLAWPAPAAAQAPESGEAPAVAVVPPSVIASVEATYPPEALAQRRSATVTLLVTVLADGQVGDVAVEAAVGMGFDEAAVAAVRQWRFVPAQRDGEPVASRIRVPFVFALPEGGDERPELPVGVSGEPSADQPESGGASGGEPPADEPIDVTVRGERELRSEQRATSDFTLQRDIIAAAPRQEGAEVLRAAPGVYIGRGEGPAVAHNYMLRGFDAEHGQDIEFRVAGLPINQPSHIHGQGYSDLGFLIGDVVREMRVSEGVYDPRQGDFAVAGSIELSLGVEESERGVRFRSGYGAFNTWRHLALWAPREESEETFGAVQVMSTDGFGENRAGQVASGLFQHRIDAGEVAIRLVGIVHGARADLAGVVRADDVENGVVCFDCVYDQATAQAQNALATRLMTGVFIEHEGADGANGQLGVWLGFDNFRIQQNFTGFIEESRVLQRVAGRGDLIEQRNSNRSLGLTGRYRTAPYRPVGWVRGTVEVGADARLDSIEQSQNLLDAAVRNQTWDTRLDAGVRAMDLGVWGDADWSFGQVVRLRAGLRADVLSYDVDDRLGNFAPSIRPQDSFIQGYRRSAMGVAAGPRTSVEVRPLHWLRIMAAWGEGYRSPQARLLEDGETAPFSKVRSGDVGVRLHWGDALELTLGGYTTSLSDDVAFDAGEGRLERIGATRRIGLVAHAVTRPVDWLVASTSVTAVDATLREPPPATADEPQPPFEQGQNLPFVPPVVVRTDVGARQVLVENAGRHALEGHVGLGFSYLSPRPLPFGQFADPVALLDASLGAGWGPLEIDLEMFNLLDTQYAAVEYSFASDWIPDDGVRSRTPARHTSAGAPLSWMVSLGVLL